MIDLDLNKEAHQEIFEALTHTFLEYLGSNLSIAVFSEPVPLGQPLSNGVLQPQGLLARNGNEAQNDCSEVLKVSPYLLFILRRIRPLIDELRGPSGLVPGREGATENGGCAAMINARIQSTLLRGLFGDQEQAFSEALRRSLESESRDDADSMADKDGDLTPEWFIGEIWNNVGWDILTQKIG